MSQIEKTMSKRYLSFITQTFWILLIPFMNRCPSTYKHETQHCSDSCYSRLVPAYLQPVLGVLVLVDVDLGLDQLEDLNCRCAGIRLYLLIMFPTAKFQTEFILSFGAFFGIFWPDKSLTLCRISEANFGLDQLEDLYLQLIFPTTTYKFVIQNSIETELICLLILFLAFLTFFGQTNHLPCAESLRPILALTNLRTSSAVALGSNSMAWNWPSMKWNRAQMGLRLIVHKISCLEGGHCLRLVPSVL